MCQCGLVVSWPEYADVALKLLDISPPIDIKVSKFRQGMTTWDYGRKNPEARDPFNINNPAYEAGAKVIASTKEKLKSTKSSKKTISEFKKKYRK